jgi:hypothetical protein
MARKKLVCPDCESIQIPAVDRRGFLSGVAATAAAATTSGLTVFATPRLEAAPTPTSTAETAVKALYENLTDDQKKAICFEWDHKGGPGKGLLRTYVSNNWHITKPQVDSDFFTEKQRDIVNDIFCGIFNPEWQKKIKKQLKDDGGGDFGHNLSCAIFGKPGDGKFEFVMTGRHLTIRADGHSESHVALGGPIFHGHAASGFTEKVHHPGNIFWHQALLANKVYAMLETEQQAKALVEARPKEQAVGFHGGDKEAKYPGIAVKGFNPDQKKGLQAVLDSLLEPYRKEDQEEVQACLKKQGGLDACYLAFYKDGDIGDDGEWDNWRLEGPSFVWYFRGEPHVHIWINVADDPSVPLNS